jgi:hypothetical protein
MPKPVCVPCERFYRPEKNGFTLLEGKPKFNGAEQGKAHTDDWEDYKLWNGDKWKCPGCGHEIVIGFAGQPVSEDYLPDFKGKVKNWAPAFRVNDC